MMCAEGFDCERLSWILGWGANRCEFSLSQVVNVRVYCWTHDHDMIVRWQSVVVCSSSRKGQVSQPILLAEGDKSSKSTTQTQHECMKMLLWELHRL